jgi:HSP20 family molecular chaperone IbpA
MPLVAGIDGGWCPAADVEEIEDADLVELELPGVKQQDVSVELVVRIWP